MKLQVYGKRHMIIVDNHRTRDDPSVLEYCSSNDIILLRLPHCTGLVQPLDVSVFGPFKKQCRDVCERWLHDHPNKSIDRSSIIRYHVHAHHPDPGPPVNQSVHMMIIIMTSLMQMYVYLLITVYCDLQLIHISLVNMVQII